MILFRDAILCLISYFIADFNCLVERKKVQKYAKMSFKASKCPKSHLNIGYFYPIHIL